MTDRAHLSFLDDEALEPCRVPCATHSVRRAPDRRPVVLEGVVRAVDDVRWAGGPVREVTLADGSDTVTLVFFGRRAAGLEPGRHVVARGTVGRHRGRRVVLNPATWLRTGEADTTIGPVAAGRRSAVAPVV
jgi:RecG-like helicase